MSESKEERPEYSKAKKWQQITGLTSWILVPVASFLVLEFAPLWVWVILVVAVVIDCLDNRLKGWIAAEEFLIGHEE